MATVISAWGLPLMEASKEIPAQGHVDDGQHPEAEAEELVADAEEAAHGGAWKQARRRKNRSMVKARVYQGASQAQCRELN